MISLRDDLILPLRYVLNYCDLHMFVHPAADSVVSVDAAFIVLHPAIRTCVNAEGRERGSVTQQAYRISSFSKSSAKCRSLDLVAKGPNGV